MDVDYQSGNSKFSGVPVGKVVDEALIPKEGEGMDEMARQQVKNLVQSKFE